MYNQYICDLFFFFVSDETSPVTTPNFSLCCRLLYLYRMPKPRPPATTLNSASGNTTSRHRDTISKPNASSDNEDVIPIPIQIFLWRQSK